MVELFSVLYILFLRRIYFEKSISTDIIYPSSSKSKEAIVNKALHYFNVEGSNCAESVYMAIFREYYKIDVNQ